MVLMQWTPAMSVGLVELDQDHKRLIDIINRPKGSATGFGDYWHTHDDDLSVINKQTLRAVGKVVLEVIYREAAGIF